MAAILAVGCSTAEPPVPDRPVPPLSGERIAFTSDRHGHLDLYVARTDGRSLRDVTRLTRHPAEDDSPCWSPDGTRIAFSSDRSGRNQVYSMTASGEDLRQLTFVEGDANHPSWSPHGDRIAFDVEKPEHGGSVILLMNADGTDVQQVVDYTYHGPRWSPDGARLAVNFGGNLGGVSVFDLDGNCTAVIPDSRDLVDCAWCFQPEWSPRGGLVMFTRWEHPADGERLNVLLYDLTTGQETSISATPGPDIGLDFSPDGSRALLLSGRDGNLDLYTVAIDGTDPRRLTETPWNEGVQASWWGSR